MWLMHNTKLILILLNTVVKEHFSPKNVYTFWYCCQSTMITYYVITFQTDEQIEVIKEEVLLKKGKWVC